MPLYKRGDIWWFDFTVNGERYRGSTQLRSKTAAKVVEDRERERAKLGPLAPRTVTLRRAADLWFASRVAGRRGEVTTAHSLEAMLRHIPGDTSISDIDAAMISEAIEGRRLERAGHNWKAERGPANGTVNRNMIDATLRPIMNHARTILGVKTQDIAWKDMRLPEPKERDRPFTVAEVVAWREGLPEWHRPLFDFYIRYGARMKEAFFPPENYDPSTGRVILRWRKNGKPHTIRLLSEDAAEMNARWTRAKAAGLSTVWFRETAKGLEGIHWRAFQSASQSAVRKAGLADVHPVHDLRHLAGGALMRGARDVTLVKRLLGHESIQSTMRYIHADDEDVFGGLRHTYGTEAEKTPKMPVKSKTGS